MTPEVKAGAPSKGAGSDGAPAGSASASSGPSARRVAAFVIGGAGVAGLIAGGVLGGLAMDQKATLDHHCGAAIGQTDPGACDPAGIDAASRGKPLAIGAVIGLAAGGAALGTAVVLFVSEPKERAPAAGARGGRVAAGVLSAGPSGGMIGAWGTF